MVALPMLPRQCTATRSPSRRRFASSDTKFLKLAMSDGTCRSEIGCERKISPARFASNPSSSSPSSLASSFSSIETSAVTPLRLSRSTSSSSQSPPRGRSAIAKPKEGSPLMQKMSFKAYPPTNCSTRSCTLGMPRPSDAPSSMSGITLSNSGPECAPVSAIRTG